MASTNQRASSSNDQPDLGVKIAGFWAFALICFGLAYAVGVTSSPDSHAITLSLVGFGVFWLAMPWIAARVFYLIIAAVMFGLAVALAITRPDMPLYVFALLLAVSVEFVFLSNADKFFMVHRAWALKHRKLLLVIFWAVNLAWITVRILAKH